MKACQSCDEMDVELERKKRKFKESAEVAEMGLCWMKGFSGSAWLWLYVQMRTKWKSQSVSNAEEYSDYQVINASLEI